MSILMFDWTAWDSHVKQPPSIVTTYSASTSTKYMSKESEAAVCSAFRIHRNEIMSKSNAQWFGARNKLLNKHTQISYINQTSTSSYILMSNVFIGGYT